MEYSDAHKMCEKLDDDEKSNREIGGLGTATGGRGIIIINESGLWSLVLRSTKPEAKVVKKWLTSEVLPAIHKTGSYIAPSSTSSRYFEELQNHLGTQKRLIESQQDQIAYIKQKSDEAVAKAQDEAKKACYEARSAVSSAQFQIKQLEEQVAAERRDFFQMERSKYPVLAEEAVEILSKLYLRNMPVREVAEAHYRSMEAIRKVRKYPPKNLPSHLLGAIIEANQGARHGN